MVQLIKIRYLLLIVSSKSKNVKTEDAPNKNGKSEATAAASSSKATDAKETKKKKKKADDNGLKRPQSAYMLYNNFRRPVLKEADQCKYKHF